MIAKVARVTQKTGQSDQGTLCPGLLLKLEVHRTESRIYTQMLHRGIYCCNNIIISISRYRDIHWYHACICICTFPVLDVSNTSRLSSYFCRDCYPLHPFINHRYVSMYVMDGVTAPCPVCPQLQQYLGYSQESTVHVIWWHTIHQIKASQAREPTGTFHSFHL